MRNLRTFATSRLLKPGLRSRGGRWHRRREFRGLVQASPPSSGPGVCKSYGRARIHTERQNRRPKKGFLLNVRELREPARDLGVGAARFEPLPGWFLVVTVKSLPPSMSTDFKVKANWWQTGPDSCPPCSPLWAAWLSNPSFYSPPPCLGSLLGPPAVPARTDPPLPS